MDSSKTKLEPTDSTELVHIAVHIAVPSVIWVLRQMIITKTQISTWAYTFSIITFVVFNPHPLHLKVSKSVPKKCQKSIKNKECGLMWLKVEQTYGLGPSTGWAE